MGKKVQRFNKHNIDVFVKILWFVCLFIVGLSGVSYATFRLEHPEDALSVLYAGLSAPNQHPCCAMRAQNLYLVNLIRGGICTRSGEMCSLTGE